MISKRKTNGVELSESDIPDDEFDLHFRQFEEKESDSEINSSEANSEKWILNDYQILHRKDAEFAYLAIIYKDQQDENSPSLYAFREESEEAHLNKPTHVQNIHGSDVYQSYIERGWVDITQSDENCPWTIKSWLALHMKQDTI